VPQTKKVSTKGRPYSAVQQRSASSSIDKQQLDSTIVKGTNISFVTLDSKHISPRETGIRTKNTYNYLQYLADKQTQREQAKKKKKRKKAHQRVGKDIVSIHQKGTLPLSARDCSTK
jgi:hypothetical protein